MDAARTHLTSTPRCEQIYSRLLREAARDHPPPFDQSRGPRRSGALRFAALSGTEAHSIVPKPFTRDAFYDFVVPRLPVLILEEMGIDWITAARTVATGWCRRRP